MDERQFVITLLNLLNRSVELNIAQGRYDQESIDGTLEEMLDIVRNRIMEFRKQATE